MEATKPRPLRGRKSSVIPSSTAARLWQMPLTEKTLAEAVLHKGLRLIRPLAGLHSIQALFNRNE